MFTDQISKPDHSLVLNIGGVEPMSAVDWPDMLCAVVFCQGCSWSCRYCHNPHLVPFATRGESGWEDFRAWLYRRIGLLDGVVFSGGEPILQPALPQAMQDVKALGFKVGLHTGGSHPDRLERLLPWVDWIGFDFKAPFTAYARVTGREHGERAWTSMELIREAGIPCEIRTTWHRLLLSGDDLVEMGACLAAKGYREWVIQTFRAEGCADPELCAVPPGEPPLERIDDLGLNVMVR